MFFSIFGISVFSKEQACRMVSLEKSAPQYILKMIKNTPDIYYAEATSYSKEDEAFTFKVTDVLHGEKREAFTLTGAPQDANVAENDFGAHKSSSFWNDVITGRMTFGSDCRLNPTFQIGNRYLVFFKEPYQAKSFELVKNKKDKWFQFVFETLYPPKRVKKVAVESTPAAQTPASAPAATPPEPAAAPTN